MKWTSGALYSAKEAADFRAKVAAAAMTEEQRLAALHADERLPLVYMDVTIKVRHRLFCISCLSWHGSACCDETLTGLQCAQGKPVGRMEFVLFTDVSPRCVPVPSRRCCTELLTHSHSCPRSAVALTEFRCCHASRLELQ